MSKQFDKQKQDINATVMLFKSAPTGPYGQKRESPFLRNRIRRAVNEMYGEAQRDQNFKERGNPVSIIANEETPNPARRDKMMKLAKYNKDRGR